MRVAGQGEGFRRPSADRPHPVRSPHENVLSRHPNNGCQHPLTSPLPHDRLLPARLANPITEAIVSRTGLDFRFDGKPTYGKGIKRPILSTTFALNSSCAIKRNLACDGTTSMPMQTTTACR
jgi:hypothetical protein